MNVIDTGKDIILSMTDLVVIFITACLYSVFCYKIINGETLPFSRSFETVQEGCNM